MEEFLMEATRWIYRGSVLLVSARDVVTWQTTLAVVMATLSGMFLVSILLRLSDSVVDAVQFCWGVFVKYLTWFLYLVASVLLGSMFTFNFWARTETQTNLMNLFMAPFNKT